MRLLEKLDRIPVGVFEKLDKIPLKMFEGLPGLYEDVKTLKDGSGSIVKFFSALSRNGIETDDELDDFVKGLKGTVEDREKIKVWINRLPWIIPLIMVTGFDPDILEKIIKILGGG